MGWVPPMMGVMKAFSILLFAALAISTFAADYAVVNVIGGKPLTNATVLSVTERGVSFKCDQGLVQVPFANLPSEFAALRSRIKGSSGATITPKPADKPIAKVGPPQETKPKSEAELAREAQKRATLKTELLNKITYYETQISRYDHQTSFSPPPLMTAEDYAVAKTGLEEAKRKLAALE